MLVGVDIIAVCRASHLDRLETEGIHILREVVAETRRPVMPYGIGKDWAVLLHLARKAFFPAPPPLPLPHVDTTWKFRAMYELRDRVAASSGMRLIVHRNSDAVAQCTKPFDHGSRHTKRRKTEELKQALDAGGYDAAFGGARRDEEKSRAKERILSFRSASYRWDPRRQHPELWNLFNTAKALGESLRAFPISNWTELDVWQCLAREGIELVPLYFATSRPTVIRDGLILVIDDDRFPLRPGERPVTRSIRCRTLGCYPLSGAVENEATTIDEVIRETLLATSAERQGRAIDHDPATSMEQNKQEGYF